MKRISKAIKGVVGFFRNVVLELRLVEWMKFSQVIKSTVIVTILVIMFVALLTGMDKLLVSLRGLFLNKPII